MVIIKADGFAIKRKHTPICEIFERLNELYEAGIISGYLVTIADNGDVIITLLGRG